MELTIAVQKDLIWTNHRMTFASNFVEHCIMHLSLFLYANVDMAYNFLMCKSCVSIFRIT